MLAKLRSNTLLAGTTVYLVANILNAIIPFALLPVLTRYLSPEEYGQVAMFQTLLGALMAFIGLSMQGAAGRKFYDGSLGKDDLAEYIGKWRIINYKVAVNIYDAADYLYVQERLVQGVCL